MGAVAVLTALVVVASTVFAVAEPVDSFPAPPPMATLAVSESGSARAVDAPPEAQQRTGTMQAYAWPAQPGDTLESVAALFGIAELDQVLLLNPELGDGPLPAGTTLYVPVELATAVPPLPGAAPATPARHTDPASGWTVWDDLALCESSGDWHIDTGNGYYGGLQFKLSSWLWVGGTGYPHEHDRITQILMAERLLALQGWEAWPVCSQRLGLR